MEFIQAIKNRRSHYALSNASPISDDAIEDIIRQAVLHSPTAFNSQSGRVVLLLGENHKKLWEIVLTSLLPLVSGEQETLTRERIAGFAAGYGSLLYYEDQAVVEGLQASFPLYKDNFPVWSLQSSGMLQNIIWTALECEGLGASLQHYNPLIDQAVAEAFSIPSSWRLLGQMPFGKPTAQPGDKEIIPAQDRILIRR